MYGSGDLEHRISQIACNWLYLIYLLYADDKLSYQRSSSPYQDTVAVHQGFPPFLQPPATTTTWPKEYWSAGADSPHVTANFAAANGCEQQNSSPRRG